MLQAVFYTVFGVVEGSWNEVLGEFDFTGPNKAISVLINLLERAPAPYGGILGPTPPVQEVQWVLTDRWLSIQPEILLVVVTEPLVDPVFPDLPSPETVV